MLGPRRAAAAALSGICGAAVAFPLEIVQQQIETEQELRWPSKTTAATDFSVAAVASAAAFCVIDTVDTYAKHHAWLLRYRGICAGLFTSPVVCHLWGARIALKDGRVDWPRRAARDTRFVLAVLLREILLLTTILTGADLGGVRSTFAASIVAHIVLYPVKLYAMNRIVAHTKSSMRGILLESVRASLGLSVAYLIQHLLTPYDNT